MSEKIVGAIESQAKKSKQNINSDPSRIAKQALAEAQARKLGETLAKELNGPKGPEPTRYGDWEIKGRCYDF